MPTVSVFVKAFAETEGSDVPAMREAMSGTFRGYFTESLQLSVVSAVIGGFLGVLLALVVVRLQRPRWLRTGVTAFSGFAANMGGIVLAFAFIAALGTQGLATKIIKTAGVDLPVGFISGFWGIVTVYSFFQIPLMFLVMLPAVDGLKPAWREAVANLGGTAATYWRRVGIPVLTPAALGGMLLLFANAFAAYATAYALSTGASEAGVGADPLLPPGQHDHRQGEPRLRPGGVDDRAHAGHDRRLPAAAPPGRTVAAMTVEAIEPEAVVAPSPDQRASCRHVLSWVFLLSS